jgi:broad specificity phosphatase PhoE
MITHAHILTCSSHQAIVRCIYAYFMNLPQSKSPWMEVPLHTLMKLTPKAYGTEEQRFKADIPAVSTWRAQGSTAKHHDSVDEGKEPKIPTITVKESEKTPKSTPTVLSPVILPK